MRDSAWPLRIRALSLYEEGAIETKIKEINKLAIVTFVTPLSVDLRKIRNKFFHKVVKWVMS